MFKIDWRRKKWKYDPAIMDRGHPHILCNWVSDESEIGEPLQPQIDMNRYVELLSHLPDKVVENLEKARLSRDGRMPMIKAGLGFAELLSSVIVDGTAIASSSTENILFPDLVMPRNYMQPGGYPARTLRWRARGRLTTLTSAATLIFSFGSGTTAVTVPSVRWCQTGAITMDTTAQTNSQWFFEGDAATRSVGTAGTVFCQGNGETAAQAFTLANQHAQFAGFAGQDTPATGSFDMTLDQYLAITAKWSLATAYSITGHMYLLESLN
jgi:hypothetical protein